MAIYPDIIEHQPGGIGGVFVKATLPIAHGSYYSVMVTEFENGIEQRRLLNKIPKRNVKINYSPINLSDSLIIKDFYAYTEGAFRSFAFYYPQVEQHIKEYVGVAADDDNRLLLPSYDATLYSLYKNGILLIETTEYVFVPKGGPDGEDLVELIIPSVAGDLYQWSFTGILKVTARFSDNPFQATDIQDLLSSFSVLLETLQADGCYHEDP